MSDKHSPPARRKVALALQGGGSHGAFTWGVLDRLLEEPTLDIIGITGTSAGAMNAVALADGLLRGGPRQARQGLRKFWTAIGEMPGFGSLLWPMSGEAAANLDLKQTPAYLSWDMLTRNLSPYDLNPSRINPLRAPLTELIDFDRLRAQEKLQVTVCATNARSATRRVFSNKEISVDAVLASACLPLMFPAVEIDGEPYWDGGYTGNPALVPLMRKLPKQKFDLIFVRIDPIIHEDTPHSVREINDRITEVIFNSTLVLELGMLAVVLKFVDEGLLDRERFGRVRFHGIEASAIMEKLATSSKLNNTPALLEYLFDLGRKTADAWWADHGAAIGQRSTVDLQKLLPEEFWS
jgi:NTE family protein